MMKDKLTRIFVEANRRPGWRSIAEALNVPSEGGQAIDQAQLFEVAESVTGIAGQSLRNMRRAHDFLLSNKQALGALGLAAAFSRPFSQVEVLMRIGTLDIQTTLDLFSDPSKCRSVRELRSVLTMLKHNSQGALPSRVKGHADLNSAKKLVGNWITKTELIGDAGGAAFVSWNGGCRFVSPSIVSATRNAGGLRASAALVSTRADDLSVYRAIARAVFEASFFDTYWLACPRAAFRYSLDDDIRRIDVSNLGLLWFEMSGEAGVALAPRQPVPSPDRRPLLHLPDYYIH